jgi:D-glycero-alpha-D-manno-heptose-7-phosphate kinase
MIISRTPFRISFFGGGTDYPVWFRRYGGSVLATTIDKYCYITCRHLPPFFEHRIRVVYSKVESCMHRDEIRHPSVREVLRFLDVDRGVEIHHDGDLPARSGMGSSSAFTVGLLNALYALKGEMASKERLARESIHIEQDILKETVGSQDQALAAWGGFNHVTFPKEGEICVRPVVVGRERLEELNASLMLLYTGIQRTASNVAGTYVTESEEKHGMLLRMRALVDEGLSLLNSRASIAGFGELMREGWEAKRGLGGKVSNPLVDDMMRTALEAGATGGKLTGAGGGGFLLLFVPPERRKRVREALGRLIHVPFRFEANGSQVIFYDPEEDFEHLDRERKIREIDRFREMAELLPEGAFSPGRSDS